MAALPSGPPASRTARSASTARRSDVCNAKRNGDEANKGPQKNQIAAIKCEFPPHINPARDSAKPMGPERSLPLLTK
jgi:hypothetical protein